jgi:hypothetical protein
VRERRVRGRVRRVGYEGIASREVVGNNDDA